MIPLVEMIFDWMVCAVLASVLVWETWAVYRVQKKLRTEVRLMQRFRVLARGIVVALGEGKTTPAQALLLMRALEDLYHSPGMTPEKMTEAWERISLGFPPLPSSPSRIGDG